MSFTVSPPDTQLSDGDQVSERSAACAPSRVPRIPGELGTWIFIFGDMAMFALLFGIFVYYRAKQPALFDHSQAMLHRTFGGANTLLLLSSSLCVVAGARAIRAQMRQLAAVAIALALICGCLFLMNKALEWTDLLSHGHNPASNNFFMYFFVLTGIHAFHLLIGMGVLVALGILSRKKTLSRLELAFVDGGACFWHMVDLLWIVLFALLYLMH